MRTHPIEKLARAARYARELASETASAEMREARHTERRRYVDRYVFALRQSAGPPETILDRLERHGDFR